MFKNADPNCEYCEGKGWFYVQNGPDDVDKDPCFCVTVDEDVLCSTVLKTYASKSNPAKKYDIIEPNGGGDPYCNCPGWKFSKDSPRSCKHLAQYHLEMQTPQQVNKGLPPEVPEVDEPIDGEVDEIQLAIDEVMKSVE